MKAQEKNTSSPITELTQELSAKKQTASRTNKSSERQYDNLQDPGAYEAFVRDLNTRIEHKLAEELAPDIEIEIANFTALLVAMPRQTIAENRVYFEMAYDLLAAENPNLLLIRSIHRDLAAASDKACDGISRLISWVSGDTPLNAALAGLLTIGLVSIIILVVFAFESATFERSGYEKDMSYFFGLEALPLGMFLLLFHAAFIGAIVSILARIGDLLSSDQPSEILIYITIVSKPFLAAAFAIAVYAIIKIGLVSFLGVDLEGAKAPYFAWLIGFLCGFSERLSQDLVSGAGNKITALNTLGANPQESDTRDRI